MGADGHNADKDAGWSWPDWVPAKVREQVESFYVYHGGHAGWLRSAECNGAPKFGSTVTLRDGFGRCAEPATGRFVFAWNNIARLVRDDGSFAYTAFHPADEPTPPPCDWCGEEDATELRDLGHTQRRPNGPWRTITADLCWPCAHEADNEHENSTHD